MYVREGNYFELVACRQGSNISNDVTGACYVSLQDTTVSILNVDISQLMFISERETMDVGRGDLIGP